LAITELWNSVAFDTAIDTVEVLVASALAAAMYGDGCTGFQFCCWPTS
jgi:hypothetical protein